MLQLPSVYVRANFDALAMTVWGLLGVQILPSVKRKRFHQFVVHAVCSQFSLMLTNLDGEANEQGSSGVTLCLSTIGSAPVPLMALTYKRGRSAPAIQHMQ